MINRLRLLFFLLLTLIFASCERRQLWDEITDLAPVDVDVDWQRSRWKDFDEGQPPTGMSVYAYDKNGKHKPVVIVTNNLEHATTKLGDGLWNMFVFNQSVMEYASLMFSGMDNYYSARVETIPQASRWFAASRAEWVTRSNSPWAAQTRSRTRAQQDGTRAEEYSLTTKQPIWIATDSHEGVLVTEDMLVREYTPHTRFDDGKFYPLSAVKNVKIKVHFKGVQNLYTTRAVISGVAKSYSIGEGSPLSELTAHEIAGWTLVKDTVNNEMGYLEATMQTFGMVRGFQYNPEDLYLHLDVMLVDGQTILTHDLPVGHLVRYSTVAGSDIDINIDVRKDNPIELPNVQMTGGGNGFDITVSDWEDEINIDIDL